MSAPLEMDYTNRDYDAILGFLVGAARGFMPEWVTAGEAGDFGTLLLELYAYTADVTNYYIDRCAAEPFLATAQRRQSVLGIADMLGYSPVPQQAASGAVTFSLDDTAYLTDSLTIPSGTLLQTLGSQGAPPVFFETVTHAFLGQSVRTMDVGVNEGQTQPIEYVAISNGAPLQEYVLMNAGVIYRSARVWVQETDTSQVEWTYVNNLIDSDPDAAVWTTYLDDQQFVHLVFGDNVAGRIPPNGAAITAAYRYGQGIKGNVAAGTVVAITPPIQGVHVVNVNGITGGADNESIDQMRYSIPRSTKIRDRAVTLKDFADIASQVPGVAKATATGQFYTNVKVFIAPVGGSYPSDLLRGQVESYLMERSLVGTTVEIHPLNTDEWLYQELQIGIELHVLKEFGQLTVKNAVHDALVKLFSFESMTFGGFISQGQVYHAVLAVPGVDYMVLTAMYPFEKDGVTPIPPVVQDIQVGPTLIPHLIDDPVHLVIAPVGGLT